MQSRLIAGTVKSQYPGLLSQPFELVVGMIVSDHHAYLRSLSAEQAAKPLVAT